MPSQLSLYHYPSCPFCYRVSSVMRNLGIEAVSRDIHQDPTAHRELMTARGRSTVPVLKIVEQDGSTRWLPESADIINYLSELK